MYENITYESILERMLERVPNTFDKREGSVIYDALAPAALELQNMYIELDNVLNESFADTATLPYLVRRAAEKGINQFPATSAILKVISTPSTIEIPIGSRFSLNELNYVITEKITDGEYTIQCETPGVVGNSQFGNIIPIDYIQGLETIEITEVLIPGQDEEDVEELRSRYMNSMTSNAYGGNIADYKEKVGTLKGVGGLKVIPVWNGGGTVKIVFVNTEFDVPSPELVANIQEQVDPSGNSGKGYGIAPIGHVVTVEGVTAVKIDIVTEIFYDEDWSWETSASEILKAIDDYFLELSKEWDDTNKLVVRISQIESRILNCEGVTDVTGTTLKIGETITSKNLTLGEYEIPTRGLINGNK